MEPKRNISLFDDVPTETTVSESYEFPTDATIESLWARNYIGHDFDLRYRAYVEDNRGRNRSLVEHLGKEFLAGDDDEHDLELREEVKAGETLHLEAENVETEYLYHANMRVAVDYEGGLLGTIAAGLGVA